MFSRSLRLGRQGFDQSRRLPRVATSHFSISYGFLPSEAGLGVIVPKKAVKSAVKRHLLKRRLREVLKVWHAPGRTIVITARPGADTLTFDQIRNELSEVFKDILPATH